MRCGCACCDVARGGGGGVGGGAALVVVVLASAVSVERFAVNVVVAAVVVWPGRAQPDLSMCACVRVRFCSCFVFSAVTSAQVRCAGRGLGPGFTRCFTCACLGRHKSNSVDARAEVGPEGIGG